VVTQDEHISFSLANMKSVIVSCEHATNHIPEQYAHFFEHRGTELFTHRGYDPGAYDFAKLLAEGLSAPLFAGKVSRLLVELNRSLTNRRSSALPSLEGLNAADREKLLQLYYHPYRQAIEQTVSQSIQKGLTTLHISVHSFTPVLNGVERSADIGFLYDPERKGERYFCDKWLRALETKNGGLRIRRNYPYRGVSDGVVTAMRKRFAGRVYIGVEVEINQIFPTGKKSKWQELQLDLLSSLIETLR